MPSSLTWSSGANAIAKIGSVVGFIEGYPKFHFIPQPLEKDLSIFLKPLNYSIILPPTNVLQRLWEVPVIESYLWRKTGGQRTQPANLILTQIHLSPQIHCALICSFLFLRQ